MPDKTNDLPAEVWIGGVKWTVTRSDDADQHCGRTRQGQQEIRITDDAEADTRRSTMIHEILHAISWMGLDERNELTETQVQAIQWPFYSGITDPRNQPVIDFITGRRE